MDVDKKEALQKQGSSLYGLKDGFGAALTLNPEVKIHQGFLETSNVNVIQEMTDMIATTRTFDSTQRAIKAYDQMDEHLNTVPKMG